MIYFSKCGEHCTDTYISFYSTYANCRKLYILFSSISIITVTKNEERRIVFCEHLRLPATDTDPFLNALHIEHTQVLRMIRETPYTVHSYTYCTHISSSFRLRTWYKRRRTFTTIAHQAFIFKQTVILYYYFIFDSLPRLQIENVGSYQPQTYLERRLHSNPKHVKTEI